MKKNGLPYQKDAGFKVPEGYFENFEDRMMTRLTFSEGELEKNPFRVPDNYFDELENRVMKNVETTDQKAKVIPLYKHPVLYYAASVAAVLAILFSSMFYNGSGELDFDDLNITAMENYLLESLDLNNPNNTEVGEYIFTASANKPNIDKEALLEYLNDHIEEPALLLNED
ncbi:hypothetical protein [Salinimicrobium xinjiangense]|uniref:hypothetical protein n=1 Tax=Salinimicrobium xinjiangense TaxID=438596 RepID=UPI0003F62172|nr:hypothetical protein [Salinimicrobium xinjiangense]